MKVVKGFLWFGYQCFAVYSIIALALAYFTPFSGWVAGFIMMSVPVVMVVNLLSIPAWLLVDRKRALLPLLLTLLSGVFLPRTFGFGRKAEAASAGSFTVMNYNAHSFMLNLIHKHEGIKSDIREMKDWVAGANADIICIPEYFWDVTETFNTETVLKKGGFRYARFYKEERKKYQHKYLGLAIFSKYPIIASRDTIFMWQNGMIQTDIKIKKDTVRVIGLHLYSMTLNLNALTHQREASGIKREGRLTLDKLRAGFIERAAQLEALKRWIHESPYPVIVCGDFNETPYGYVYGELRAELGNAFEEKGKGFGFTFNQSPYIIRIDHQFFDHRLQVLDYTTHSDVKFSDHYPVSATYSFKK